MSSIYQLLESQMNLLVFHPLTVLPFAIFIYFIYKWFYSSDSTAKHLPPSPTKLPIIGNLHQIGSLAHRSLHKLSQQHGELMLLHFGQKPVLVVSSAKTASEIMRTHDSIFADRPPLIAFQRLLFNCKNVSVAPYGEYWKQVRSICVLQLLSAKRVHTFHSIREEEVAQVVKNIEMSSTTVNLSKIFVNFSSDVICRVAFGMKFNGERDGINFKVLMEKHEELIGGIYVGDFIPWLAWIKYVNGVEADIKKVARDMNTCLGGIVQEHKDHRGKDLGRDYANNDEKPKDLVDVLLGVQHDDTAKFSLDNEGLKGIILDMFVAGTTTTYATLEWTMSELLRNPSAMESVKEEVRRIIRGKSSITDEDLEQMIYLKAVIKESLRLHPPVPLLLPRISMQNAKINGYEIAAGTMVIVNAWAIQRDPASWNEPEEFKPERFLDSPIDFRGQYFSLIPFGSGRRSCPGIHFAVANIELLLANLIKKFDWELPGGAEGKTLDMSEHPGLTTHKDIPLLAVATPQPALA